VLTSWETVSFQVGLISHVPSKSIGPKRVLQWPSYALSEGGPNLQERLEISPNSKLMSGLGAIESENLSSNWEWRNRRCPLGRNI
jgi:hypothetical protein